MAYDPAKDRYIQAFKTVDHPQREVATVTPSDTVDFDIYAFGLKCNADGTIYILPVGNYKRGAMTPIKWVVSAGDMIPIQVARVFASGTTLNTAGDIQAWYQ